MIAVVRNSWALLLGVMLLMIGNGLQGTLLGVRGSLEGFSATTMSWVMSAYFMGFLGGSRMAPYMIRRVGHVRVFAALASLVSAAFVLYAAYPNPWFWSVLRVLVGFCFSGIYVTAESWLNDQATNETRGQSLSAYLIVQMVGVVVAQFLLTTGDPNDYILFVMISVLVSVSFAPILLSVSPAPVFQTAKPMSLRALFAASPLGMVGVFLLGGVFSALYGMVSVYATEKGLSLGDISIFIAIIYFGGMVMQYPLGRLSDLMDRRRLIVAVTAAGAVVALAGIPFTDNRYALLLMGFVVGGVANPLYSLLLAYTNDFLEPEDMAAASGGLIFANGTGAIAGPFIVGFAMTRFGADSFFVFVAILFAMISAYGTYRMTQRAAPSVDETMTYTAVLPQSSPVAVNVAQEVAAEQQNDELETAQ